MFGYLKKKLGDVVGKFSKNVEEESEILEDVPEDQLVDEKPVEQEESVEQEKPIKKEESVKKEEPVEQKSVKKEMIKDEITKDKHIKKQDDSIKSKDTNITEADEPASKGIKERVDEQSAEHIEESDKEEHADDKETTKKSGFFSKISNTFTKFKLSDEKFEDLFWDLEVALLENNVALEVIQKIKDDLKDELTQDKISRKKASDIILDSLHKSIKEVLSVEKLDLLNEIKHKKPYVIAVIGVNGSGKTTTIAKLCNYLKKQNKSVVLAAADTFRAAAIQQLEHHANALDIKLIKHEYNSDPSAVAFDAIRHAESKELDVVIIDTAGRLHSNDNLMNELKKLVRVNKPDLKLFIGESITGNDCVEQAKKYDEIIGIDAIILSKADIDDKGGAALSISYVTKKPVIFIGTGQNYDDLQEYDEKKILSNLGI